MFLTISNAHWLEQFSQEYQRLLSTLNHLTAGGIIEDIQHIGSTSVLGLLAWPCIDIAISIWPFPLESESHAKLELLGYKRIPGREDAPEQRFRHVSSSFQLIILEAGGEQWTDYCLMRDYWQSNEHAYSSYSMFKKDWEKTHVSLTHNYQIAKTQFFNQTLEKARQWWIEHRASTIIQTIAKEMQGFSSSWYISGGWALDLFMGRVTRVHHDIDIVVARADQLALQTYMTTRGWRLMTPWEGRLEPWPLNMRLELPRQQIHAFRNGAFIDIQLSDIDQKVWHYRRDTVISRSVERIRLRSDRDIPFLAPELVLLFKSKNTSNRERPKDQADFERIYVHLEPERRAWLIWAVMATDPAHLWIKPLIEGNWW
jgi:GrpB-like predicted nucleotidyltransferase (UPF0157 family)